MALVFASDEAGLRAQLKPLGADVAGAAWAEVATWEFNALVIQPPDKDATKPLRQVVHDAYFVAIANGAKVRADAAPDAELVATWKEAKKRQIEFLKDQFRHCKSILVMGGASALLTKAGIPMDQKDAGLVLAKAGADPTGLFIAALAKHRHVERDRDPPPI